MASTGGFRISYLGPVVPDVILLAADLSFHCFVQSLPCPECGQPLPEGRKLLHAGRMRHRTLRAGARANSDKPLAHLKLPLWMSSQWKDLKNLNHYPEQINGKAFSNHLKQNLSTQEIGPLTERVFKFCFGIKDTVCCRLLVASKRN